MGRRRESVDAESVYGRWSWRWDGKCGRCRSADIVRRSPAHSAEGFCELGFRVECLLSRGERRVAGGTGRHGGRRWRRLQVRWRRGPLLDEAFEDRGGLSSTSVCATHLAQYPAAGFSAVPSILRSPPMHFRVGRDEGEEMGCRSREGKLRRADRRVPEAWASLIELRVEIRMSADPEQAGERGDRREHSPRRGRRFE